MLQDTNYKGFKQAGKIYGDIPSDVIKRWEKRGIAQIEETVNFSEMSAKELFDLCKEQDIKLSKEMINGHTEEEKHEYLVSMLSNKE